jgi:hypothetical protein
VEAKIQSSQWNLQTEGRGGCGCDIHHSARYTGDRFDAKSNGVRMRIVQCLLYVLMLTLCSVPAWGQAFTGRVTDQTGAVVPKAKITVHNVATNVDTKATATGTGNYTVPYLKPGVYQLSASAQGFETTVRTGLNLQVDQTATVDFALKVGEATETITVQGDALIDFAKADAGEVVENTRVTELPLNGRDPGMLSELVAGASFEGYIGYQRPFDDTQQQLTVNGGGTGNTELMLDGVSNSTGGINETGLDRIAYVPPVDSVQEFKIITNPYDAKYGLLAGGVEDVTLKSGTNKIHGDVYEFARRTWLDANTWQNDWNIARATPGTDVSQFQTLKHKLDQYGAELDGPVYIPKLYDGRGKSFFTMQYENWNESAPDTTTTSVPSPQWLKGDFSNLVYLNGNSLAPITLYDPLSITQNPITGVYTRVPFGPNDPINPTSAANIIPASRINPVALKILSYLPAPNTAPSSANPFQNNYTLATPAINKYRNVLGKFDQNLSASDRFSLHYGYWEREEIRNGNGIPGPAASGLLPHVERSNTFTLEETHTFSSTLLLDFRATVAARTDGIINGPAFDPTTLGWSPAQVAAMGSSAKTEFPYIQLNEFVSTGQNGTNSQQSNTLALFPSVMWIKGNHVIHGGLDARFWQSDNTLVSGGNNFWVDRTWTQMNCGSCGSWDPASGNSIASFLLGNPTSGSNAINVNTFWSAHYWAPFVQDDWKVTKRLTLNLGVRWDFLPSEVERHNRTNWAFNTTAVNPISSEVTVPGYSQIQGGVTFAGVNGNPRGAYALGKGNIQPRVGFAFAVDPKTVLRGGFGETMRTPQNNAPSFGYSATTNYQANDPTHPGQTYPNLANQIDNPYSLVVQPTGSSLGMLEQLGQSPWTVNQHYKIPSFWNYSVGMEHQFLTNDLIKIAYVGSQLFNGDSHNNLNPQSTAAMTPCNPQLGGNPDVCNNDNVPNPFIGVNGFQGSNDYSATTINGLTLTQPFPQFGGVEQWQENRGHSWYNALQVTALHKWNHSLTMHGTYTWSKLMDSGGWADETYQVLSRSIDGSDRTNRVTLSGVYLLPVGRGRNFLSNAPRAVDAVIGGWELSSLYIYMTGTPWSAPNNNIQSAYVHPHIEQATGFIRLAAPCAEQYVRSSTNSNLWALQPLTLYQTDVTCHGPDFQVVPQYGENTNVVYSGIRLPRVQQFDTSLAKNFKIVERLGLQIRIDAFNVLNHPLWSEGPDNNLNDSTFGTIERGPTGQSNLPRQVQLSAKVSW